jgi:hypothetical protein
LHLLFRLFCLTRQTIKITFKSNPMSRQPTIRNSLSLSNIKKADVYSTLSFPDLFGMNGEQHIPPNERNLPSPAHLCSPAQPGDGIRPDAEFKNLHDSSSPHCTSNFVNCLAHDLKVAADQGIAAAQLNYGICLKKGEGVGIDFQGAAHYFKLAADQGVAGAQYNYGLCLNKGAGYRIDFLGAAHYF